MTIQIPEKISMKVAVYGDGAKGMAFQIYRCDEHGIECEARREKRGAPWVEKWTHDLIPGVDFSTFKALVAHAATVEPVKPAVELLAVVPRDRGTGHCWLCRGEWVHTVRARAAWRPADIFIVPSCDGCLEKIKADPLAAREERRRYVAANNKLATLTP